MFTINLIIVTSIFAVILIIIYSHTNSNLRKLASRFPGPLSLPIVGNVYLFIGMNTEEMLIKYNQLVSTYPSPFRIWLGPRLGIIIYNPEQIKIIINNKKSMGKPVVYEVAKPWAGNGLVTAPASIWHVHRKIIQPAFNQKVLQTFVGTFQRQSIILTNEIASNVDGKEFDITEFVSLRTLNFICETTMGTSIMSNKEICQKYFEAVKTAMQVFVDRTIKIWLTPDIIFNRTKLAKESELSINLVNKVSSEVIQRRNEEIANTKGEIDANKRKPFLELMMTENKLSDKELRDEVNTIIFAGFDTNSCTTSFALLMLASHPEIQDQVYEEIYSIYGSEDPEDVPIKPEDLQHLVLLERVIKETMRIFPVIPFFGRQVDENLEIGDYTLPKSSMAVISIWTVHRNENIWPDPLKFDPDRFLPEEVAKRHPYSYIPFSAGPRNCIGQVYAMMALKVLLATILRKYVLKKDNIKPIKDIRLKLDILLRNVEPITLRLEKRIKK